MKGNTVFVLFGIAFGTLWTNMYPILFHGHGYDHVVAAMLLFQLALVGGYTTSIAITYWKQSDKSDWERRLMISLFGFTPSYSIGKIVWIIVLLIQ